MKMRFAFVPAALIFGVAVGSGQVPVGPQTDILSELEGAGNPAAIIDMFRQSEVFGLPSPGGVRDEFLLAKSLFLTEGPENTLSAGAKEALERFVARYPASPDWPEAVMMLGDCCFFDGDYAGALRLYGSVDLGKISADSDTRTLYAYRLCVTRLMNGIADPETLSLLKEFADKPGYRLAGQYYRAYYDYLNRDYPKAYAGFEKVAETLASGKMLPEGMAPRYYMVQILYRNGKFADVIKTGRMLMSREPVERLLPELHRVVGLSYFKTGDHESAHGLLERYVDDSRTKGYNPASDAVYALGVCEYEQGEPEKAAERFTTLTDLQDMTGQGSWYHLGEIAMKGGRYDEAVIAFGKAAQMGYDGNMAERAAYNRIAAVTHGGRSPFQSTPAMYEDFLALWPESRYADDVRRGFYQACAAQSDYDNALDILDKIRHPDQNVRVERQKLLYAKGTRLERAGRHKEAAATLREAVREGADPALTSEAGVWLGDALYGTGDYAGSVQAFDKALEGRNTVTGDRRGAALYQRGYSNMRSGRYAQAARDFNEVLKGGKVSKEITEDARLRLADCQYYSGNLSAASETYKEVREMNTEEGDYATLRLAMLAGLQGDRVSETAMLRDFLRNSPGSPLRAEAMSKLGASLEARNLGRDAVSVYDDLLKEFPASPYTREGALRSARLTLEAGDTDEAVRKFRGVIERWPESEEAAAADLTLRDHYAGNGELENYAAWLLTVGNGPRIRESEVGEITFRAAERAYVADQNDVKGMKEYIAKYPDGDHVSEALLWIAVSAFDNGRSREALEAVERILDEYPASAEADDARLLKEDLGEYSELFDAMTLADSGKDTKRGLEALRKIARNPDSAVGAQANVELGERLLKAGRNKEALEQMEAFTASGTEQQYWLAKGFLLLADIYHADGKTRLAREYVVSLRDNYPGNEPDIREGISQRLGRYSGDTKSSDQSSTTRKSRKRK